MAETLTFWLLIPLSIYIVAGGLAGREMARMLGRAPRRRHSPAPGRPTW